MATVSAVAQDDPQRQALEFYRKQVEPLLKSACFECHSHASGEASGKLMLDSSQAIKDGGTRGPAVIAGQPEESLLYKAVSYADPDLQMPPTGQLTVEQREILRAWIAAGAVAPATSNAGPQAKVSPAELARTHWAYQVPRRTLQKAAGTGSTIDQLLLVSLRANGLQFSPPADRRTLVRRFYYDLTGLPPTYDEVEQFANDPRSDEQLVADQVDVLLSSPRFGERWARYWMDVSRYADTKGYVFQEDRQYPEAYRYRDWLIEAFNSDLPYSDFVRKQLAADLEENADRDLPALGFLTLGRRFLNNKQDIIDDRLDVVTRGLMGMTLACARCHDHKYDPVSQADYYALYGVFLNTDEPGGAPFAHRLAEAAENRKSFVFIRGNARSPGAEVERRFVSFLSPDSAAFSGTGSGRGQLAASIVSPDNPLTARVIVNRVWMRLMGASLTESPSDFGLRCPPPRQQALLDQMAVDFMQQDWSLKRLIRSIMLSQAYQQQSLYREEAAKADAANELYWRFNRRRRDFESIRDAMLAVSDQLDPTLYGQPVKIQERPFPPRRTIYAHIDRQNLPSMFRSFDLASPDSHNPARPYTSVPQQGLFILNSDFVSELAVGLGDRFRQQASATSPSLAAQNLMVQILGRVPTAEESKQMLDYAAVAVDNVTIPERWICGYANFDAAACNVAEFRRLPTYAAETWRGQEGLPDKTLGWCHLNRNGGHPGERPHLAAVRRWIAPRAGVVTVTGQLKHEADKGDGVRASIVVDSRSSVGQWTAKKNSTATDTEHFSIEAGQTLDFVTDCIETIENDSFQWRVKVHYTDGAREGFDSVKEHPEPLRTPMDSWQQLAQALMASNEFAFID